MTEGIYQVIYELSEGGIFGPLPQWDKLPGAAIALGRPGSISKSYFLGEQVESSA